MSAGSIRASAVALLATLAALGAVLLPATAAQAAGRTVDGGRLDWGIKSSFQSYVTGPVAKGGFKLKNGAATAGGSLFRFHSASGSYDPDSGSLQASFSGGVSFQGHQKADGTYELDMSVSRPTVKISGGSGTLYVDVSSKAKEGGAVTTAAQVPFAKLGLGGVNMKGGGSPVALANIPATLTEQGAKAFAGYYAAGAQLDPVSLSVDVKAVAPAAEQPASSSPSSSPAEGAASQSPQAAGQFADAAVDWGCGAPSASTSPAPSARASGSWPKAPRTAARCSASRRARARTTARRAPSTPPSPGPCTSPGPTST